MPSTPSLLRRLTATIAVAVMFLVGQSANAQAVSFDPLTPPVAVATTELRLTLAVDHDTITPPGQFLLTFVVTNTGPVDAHDVSIENTLPVVFAYTAGANDELRHLGSLAPGESISTSYAVTVPAATKSDRYINEVIASAGNAASIQTEIAINVNAGQVLGATDTDPSVLAETGRSTDLVMLLGAVSIALGLIRAKQVA